MTLGRPLILRRVFHRLAASMRAESDRNEAALQALACARFEATQQPLRVDPLLAEAKELPEIDITAVTYNNGKWLADFAKSLITSDYPKEKLNLFFVDNGSSDDTVQRMEKVATLFRGAGIKTVILHHKNKGYGAGQDAAIRAGRSPYILATNIDLTFEAGAIKRLAATAVADDLSCAAWEMREKPHEDPKYYDPVTGLTNWNTHACVLLRRTAYERVGGYDKNIFMYAEDVELSYKLRAAGYKLKYCPLAAVNHDSYDDGSVVRPLQYRECSFGNLYLRLKYGNLFDCLAVPALLLRLALQKSPYVGARKDVCRVALRLLRLAPKALGTKRTPGVAFPFWGWAYELARDGAEVENKDCFGALPLVSIIVRARKGRNIFLRQALLAAAHQTYPHIEYIVIEEDSEAMRAVVENVAAATGRTLLYLSSNEDIWKVGEAAAAGRWILFLEDDALLFADHVELLANALLDHSDADSASSLYWDVGNGTLAAPEKKKASGHHLVLFEKESSATRTVHVPKVTSILF